MSSFLFFWNIGLAFVLELGRITFFYCCLANAIGLEALKQGYKVLLLHINDLIAKLNAARADGSIRQLMNMLVGADLLIFDELDLKKNTF